MTLLRKLVALYLLAHSSALWAQTEVLNTSAQVGAATSSCFTANVPIYEFTYNATSGSPVFSDITGFTTSGTYTASDIIRFRLYQTNFSVFNTTTPLATITTGLGPGAHTFPAFSTTIPAGNQRYYWVTVDLTGSAVSGHTIICNVITAGMMTITGTITSGTNNIGGTQTISCILPVELQNFSGTGKEAFNELEWTTASENNNQYFTLERSTDGSSFTPVAQVAGAGNSSETRQYTALDYLETETAETHYRLLQTDYDGSAQQLGNVITIHNKEKTYRIFPNPAGNYLNIEGLSGNAFYCLKSMDSQTICSGNISPNHQVELSGIAKGIYVLEIHEGKKTQVEKLVVE